MAYDISQIAGTVTAISTAITMRPPKRSVQMPSGTRISEPVSTGIAVSRPNSVALRLSVFLIGMPITPNIIQTMKQTVNASVLTASTDQDWRVAIHGVGGRVPAMFLVRHVGLRKFFFDGLNCRAGRARRISFRGVAAARARRRMVVE